MGLDQWLYQKIRVDRIEENKPYINIKTDEEKYQIKLEESISGIWKEVMYWRKNYALNDYFLGKCGNPQDDNCVYMHIDSGDIEELIDILQEIVDAPTDKEKKDCALKHFPSTEDLESWFFKYYLPDFKDTLEKLKEIKASPEYEITEFYYYIWY